MYEYNDGLCPGGRTPRLYLAKGGEVKKFCGENIPGYCAVVAAQYKKSGKWSSTTYQIEFVPGVRPLYFLSPLHGTWGDKFTSWGEVVEDLGLPIEVGRQLIGVEYPSTASRLDEVEKFALEIEANDQEVEIVIISFGSPTNRSIREGYWEQPKSSQASNGQKVSIAPGISQFGSADWYSPSVLEPKNAKIISSKHSPGMHGGYWTVEVAVPMNSSE